MTGCSWRRFVAPKHGRAYSAIQLLWEVPHAARTENAYAAMSERVEAVFPVEREQTEQGHWGILS
jgi:hypothetical protein